MGGISALMQSRRRGLLSVVLLLCGTMMASAPGVAGAATPTLTTNASGLTTVGGSVYDIATLAGGLVPTGTITFGLFAPGDTLCTRPAVFASTVPVNGNGNYGSALYSPTQAGTHRWVAYYGGDGNNDPVLSPCNAPNESVVVTLPSNFPPAPPQPEPFPTSPVFPPVPPAPDRGLSNCGLSATMEKDGSVKVCNATNPPTESTSQTITGKIPARLDASARRKKRRTRSGVLGRGKTTISPGEREAVVAKLRASARREVARRGKLSVRVIIETRGAEGQTVTVTKAMLVKAARRKGANIVSRPRR